MSFRFGDFELAPERYELTRSGARIRMEPRVLEVLAYLVANRERVVAKAELLDRLWHGVVVSEAALTRSIREARRALGSALGRSWIRTVYGRGFQFIGPVTVPLSADAASGRVAGSARALLDAQADPAPAGSVASAASSIAAAPPAASVAVLPFADLSPAGDQRYFCDGLAEELTGALARIDGLSVASRTSSFQCGGPERDIRQIGARLGVATVLEGSVRRDGGRLRISAQLIDATDDRHLWAAVFERELQEVFAIQIEIAERIVHALRVVMSDRERMALHRVPRVEVGAYDWYLRGRHHIAHASGRNLEAGRQMFRRAIELAPDFVPALAGLAESCAWLYLCWGGSERDLVAADEASRRAIALAPYSADAHASRAMVSFLLGQPEEMELAFEASFRLDHRLFKPHYVYARACWLAGHLPTAAHHLERSERLNPAYPALPSLLAKVYERLGRVEDATAARLRAVAVAEQALAVEPDNLRALYLGASALAGLGDHGRSIEWADRACALDPADQVAREYAAAVHARAGNVERAFECLQEAIDAGYRHFEWIVCEPDFESLLDEPRLRAMLAPWRGPEPLGAAALALRKSQPETIG